MLFFFFFSEKLLRPLANFVVPVVYGAEDTYKVAPPHSFVHTKDFKSPEDLAKYLLFLDQNQTEYMSYFFWKTEYQIFPQRSVFCAFCQFLHTSQKQKILKDFSNWFFKQGKCNNSAYFVS